MQEKTDKCRTALPILRKGVLQPSDVSEAEPPVRHGMTNHRGCTILD